MNSLSTRNRQIVYIAGILVLFVAMLPYSWYLNGVKESKDLGEATIGRIDSGSFLFKIAQLAGWRGIAANILWNKAQAYQRAQDWDQLKVNVDLITQLQPHFLAVWTFQGWNLAYNVSVEWDAPEDKYSWIKQGIKFLQNGVQKNRKSPDLIWDTAFTYYHKVGFSDESIFFRRLFHDDPDEAFRTYVDTKQNERVGPLTDNFLVAYGWYSNAIALVDAGASRLSEGTANDVEYVDRVEARKSRPDDLAFRCMPPHALTRYAAGLEKSSVLDLEASFGERARGAWDKALGEWNVFGTYAFPAHNDHTQPIYLDDAFDPKKLDARCAGMDAKRAGNQRYWTDRWAEQMNYRYWKDRSLAEREDKAVLARQAFYQGTKAYKGANFLQAVDNFREGLELWKGVMDHHPIYLKDDMNKRDTGLVVKRYVRALVNAGMETPKDLPFGDLLKAAEMDDSRDPFDQNENPVASPTAAR